MANTKPPPLVYSAALKAGELRLVALQPGEQNDALECKIEYSTFKASQEERKYNALSYMWGSPDELRELSIDGRTFPVRENLWWALYHLRVKDKVVVLWIDALCINQEDIAERNYQVGQMDLVYKAAEEVVIWVGRESPNDSKAVEYIQEIFDKKEIPTRAREFYHPEAVSSSTDWNSEWVERHSHMWKDIAVFCFREYWTREWIIQEVMLASEAYLVCGDKRIDWRTVRDVLYPVASIDKHEYVGLIQSSPLRGVIGGKGSELKLLPLVDLIVNHRLAKCFERRDKVFGVLSIAASCCRAAVTVDYSKPEHVLFVEVILHYLQKHDGSDFMLDVRRVSQLFFEDQSDGSLKTATDFLVDVSESSNLLEVPAQINDVVSYCTPSLDSLPPEYENTLLSNSGDWSPSPTLVKRICYLFHRRQEDQDKAEPALSSVDNIEALDWKVSLDDDDEGQMRGLLAGYMPLSEDYGQGSWSEGETPEYDDESSEDEDDDENSEDEDDDAGTVVSKDVARDGAMRLIRDAEKMIKTSPVNSDSKLFFTRNGTIGFGPSTLMTGDFLCHFNNSGMDIMLRLLREADEGKLVTVGTTMGYFATDTPVQEDTALYRPEIRLHFDFRTALLITLPEKAAR